MTIYLKDIWLISNPTDYKVHFARWNGVEQPLEAWTRNREEWQGWQEYRPGRNDFNRKFIFSLMQFYHEVDSWLFGGTPAIPPRVLSRLSSAGLLLTDGRLAAQN